MRKSWYVIGAAMGAMALSAGAQVVPPAPPKTPPTPEYTPPPPPPVPSPVAPRDGGAPDVKPEPEAPLPSLVERDDAGKLKMLGMPAEEAAVRALKLNEETMKKVEASLAGRRNDLDRLIIENVEALVDLHKFSAKVDEKTSLDDITVNAKKALPFKNFVGVIDRLSREGAIDPQSRSRATRVAQEYQKAADAEVLKGFEHGNTQAMVLVGYRRYVITTTTEAYAALDRQLSAAAAKFDDLVRQIELPDEMRAGATGRMRSLPKAGTPEADAKRLEAIKGVFYDVLGPEERQALLRANSPALFAEKPAEAK